jgi:glycosyltransferase involved in cell wall biosynthesis
MKTIVLIDIHQDGHHLMYLQIFSKILLDLGHQVLVFCPTPDALKHWIAGTCPETYPLFQSIGIEAPPPVSLPIVGRLPQVFNVLVRWQQAASLIRQATSNLGKKPDLVCFNWIDSYLSHYLPAALVDVIFPYPWFGLCFQPKLWSSSLKSQQTLVNYHQALNARHCRSAGVLDETQRQLLQKQILTPVLTFPDVTDASEPDFSAPVVQQLRARAKGRKIIALLGSLNKRKGLLTLLEVAQRSQAQPWLFAFIGQLSTYTLSLDQITQIQAIASTNPDNCFFHFQHIPNEAQFNALVSECHILFVAYEKFPYSSNLLTKSALFCKPVIASDEGCMGERVRQFQLGLTIPSGNAGKCFEAIQKLCADNLDGQTASQSGFKRYQQEHSTLRLQAVIQHMLTYA